MKKAVYTAAVLAVLPLMAGCETASSEEGLQSGTFTGVGEGYNDEIELNVTIDEGVVSSIDTVWHDETASVFDNAWAGISEDIIGQNSTEEVEVVSGATGSSNGIIAAIDEALEQSLNADGEAVAEASDSEDDTEDDTEMATSGELDLDQVNEFLNTSAGLGPGSIANEVQIIPHAHIDGPEHETDFYAFVNFKNAGRDYIKYQVSYLSCTCRSASVNYWQTAYIELSLPESREKEDIELKTLSFDTDSSDSYLAGFWGDSDPTPAGVSYETFKTEFIPHFENKDASYLQSLSTIKDIDLNEYQDGEGRENFEIDTYTGSSVSANNIIRIVDAMIDYHAQDDFFQN